MNYAQSTKTYDYQNYVGSQKKKKKSSSKQTVTYTQKAQPSYTADSAMALYNGWLAAQAQPVEQPQPVEPTEGPWNLDTAQAAYGEWLATQGKPVAEEKPVAKKKKEQEELPVLEKRTFDPVAAHDRQAALNEQRTERVEEYKKYRRNHNERTLEEREYENMPERPETRVFDERTAQQRQAEQRRAVTGNDREKYFGKGNIDLYNRPQYVQNDGSISTVNSISINDNGKEVLIPTIAYDAAGRPTQLTDEQAIQRYRETGENLGKFNTVEEADAYAQKLHEQQADIYRGYGEETAAQIRQETRDAEQEEMLAKYAQSKNISLEQARAEFEAAKAKAEGASAITSVDDSKRLNDDENARLVRNARAEAWLDPSYKLNKQEIADAKQMIADWRKETGGIPHSGDDETNRNMAALEAKISKLSAGALGMWQPFDNIGNIAMDAAASAVGGDFKKQIDDQQDYIRNARQNARMQHGGSYQAGVLGGNALLYTATNGPFDKIGELFKLGPVGKFVANQLAQNAQDLALDTIPQFVDDIKSGKSVQEALGNAGWGSLFNAGGNLFMGAGSELLNPRMIPALKQQNVAQQEYVDALKGYADNVLHPLAEDADNIAKQILDPATLARQAADDVDTALAQRNAAAGELETLAKQAQDIAEPEAPVMQKPEPQELPAVMSDAERAAQEAAKQAPKQAPKPSTELTDGLAPVDEFANRWDRLHYGEDSSEEGIKGWEREFGNENHLKTLIELMRRDVEKSTDPNYIAEGRWLMDQLEQRLDALSNPKVSVDDLDIPGRFGADADYKWSDDALREEADGYVIGLSRGAERTVDKKYVAEALTNAVSNQKYVRKQLAKFDLVSQPKLRQEAQAIERYMQDMIDALNRADIDAVEEAKKSLNNARRRFDTAAKKLPGYDGEFGTKTFSYMLGNPYSVLKKGVAPVDSGDEVWHMFNEKEWMEGRQKAVNSFLEEVQKHLKNDPAAAERLQKFAEDAHRVSMDNSEDAAKELQESFRAIQGDLTEPIPAKALDTFGNEVKVNYRTPLKLDLQFFGGKADDAVKGADMPKAEMPEAPQLQEYTEWKRVDDFMQNSKPGTSIETDKGSVIEHYSKKEMMNILREYKQNDALPSGNAVSILYTNGEVKSWTDGDDLGDMKLTGIEGIIWDNENTTAYAGRGARAYNNYKINGDDYENGIWRVDFDVNLKNTDENLLVPEAPKAEPVRPADNRVMADDTVKGADMPKVDVRAEEPTGVEHSVPVSAEAEKYRAEIRALDAKIKHIEENGITIEMPDGPVKLDRSSTDQALTELRAQRYIAEQNLAKATGGDVTGGGAGGPVPPRDVPPSDEPPIPPAGDVVEPGKNESKVATNTLRRSGVFSEDEYDDIIRPLAGYTKQGEDETLELAKSRLLNDHDGTIAKYTQDKPDYKSFGAADVDAMMLALQEQKAVMAGATDEAERAAARENIRKIAKTLKKTGTENGRAIQAFAKWTRTADGAISAADAMSEGAVEGFLSKNPKLAKEIEDVAGEISERVKGIYEGNPTPKARQEIIEAINEVLNNHGKVGRRINDEGVNRIADAILKDNAYDSIQDQLEFLSSGALRVSDDVIDRVNQLYDEMDGLDFDSKAYVEKEREAFRLIANSISNGGTFREKFDQWRYLAMLFNPTTHIRNIAGNVAFRLVNGPKDVLAGLIEAAADRVSKATGNGGIQRTKTVLRDPELIEACRKDGIEHAYRELTGNKYIGAANGIESQMPTWNPNTKGGRAMNAVSNANTNALSKEDEFFKFGKMGKFQTAMAGYLKANGADASIFSKTDDASKQLVEEARNYAIGQARIATFQQDGIAGEVASSFGNGTATWRNSNNWVKRALGLAADVTIPFKKTPANILESALAYSPLELAKTFTVDTYKLAKGTMKAADYIDNLSKGITGTTGLIFGAILAREGIISVDTRQTDRGKSFDKDTGRQNLAIKVGNTYFGLDQLIPTAAPLIYGATIYDAMNGGDDDALDAIVTGAGALANGITEMTMLSGIADTLSSVRYANSDSEVWTSLAGQLGSNLAGQLLPTLGRKIATTIDDTKRTSYTDNTGKFSKFVGSTGRYLESKIPGLQKLGETLGKSENERIASIGDAITLQPTINSKGEEVKNTGGNFLGRAANNLLNPLNITVDRSTPLDNELRRLAKTPDNDKLIPDITTKESQIDGYKLTPQEWTDYQKKRGQTRENMSQAFIDNPMYDGLSDANRAEVFAAIDGLSKTMTQGDYGKEMSKKSQGYADLYREKGPDAVVEEIMKDVKLTGLAKERGGEEASATKGMREAYEKGGDEAVNEYLDARYNEYGLDPDYYKKQMEAGEDLSKYKGYGEVLSKYDVEDKEAYREAWNWGKEQAVAKEVEYQKAVKEAGTTASKGCKTVWENARKTGKDPVEELRKFGEAKDAAKGKDGETTIESILDYANSTPGVTKETLDLLKPSSATGNWQYSGGGWKYIKKDGTAYESTKAYEPLEKLGMSGKLATQSAYDRAHKEIPSLTPERYAGTVKIMDTGRNGDVSQKEMVSYLNKYDIPQLEAQKYWVAFGFGDAASYLATKGGEYVTKRKKK